MTRMGTGRDKNGLLDRGGEGDVAIGSSMMNGKKRVVVVVVCFWLCWKG